jgi:hypothetical protein
MLCKKAILKGFQRQVLKIIAGIHVDDMELFLQKEICAMRL